MKAFGRNLWCQKGVALVTVLFVGAALTVMASTATFITIQDYRAGRDDRKAAEALAYAEAGIDRMILELRRGSWTWGNIRLAGCDSTHPPLVREGGIGSGRFSTRLTTFDGQPGITSADRVPPAAGACANRTRIARIPQLFAITSTGTHPSAKRVVRQVLQIQTLGLPIGVFAETIDANGSGGFSNVSMFTPGDITGREKIAFTGIDPYFTMEDFYPGREGPIPAAAHAVGSITCVANCNSSGPNRKVEHPPSPNCGANGVDNGQSLWDGSRDGTTVTSGCPGQSGFPPTAFFGPADLQRLMPALDLPEQDYLNLKEAAKNSGLYCTLDGCLSRGVPRSYPSTVQPADIAGMPNTFVAYFDFPAGSNATVKWKAEVAPCSGDPSVNRSMVLIVRNGHLSMQSGAYVTGAVLVPEGILDSEGRYDVHGTVIADELRIRGGANFQMSQCWIDNIPSPMLEFKTMRWSEIDR